MTKKLKRKVRHISFKVLEMHINSLLEELRYETFDNFYRDELRKSYDEIIHDFSKNENYKDFIPSLDTEYKCSTDSWGKYDVVGVTELFEHTKTLSWFSVSEQVHDEESWG